MKTCTTCVFWIPDPDGNEGQCRREPPRASMVPIPHHITGQMQMSQISLVAKTGKDYWCGEHAINDELTTTLLRRSN